MDTLPSTWDDFDICFVSKPYLPPLVSPLCDGMLSDLSSNCVSAQVDLEEKSGVDFSKVVSIFNHDGTAFADQRRGLEEVL